MNYDDLRRLLLARDALEAAGEDEEKIGAVIRTYGAALTRQVVAATVAYYKCAVPIDTYRQISDELQGIEPDPGCYRMRVSVNAARKLWERVKKKTG
ncbi:MAG: hypothetical protein LBB86_01235 [Oscillospiraceae bacterium]|jgi:hypothetical protein|nr:hypothetical protein [Oscillospiraceae bacterium]